MKNNKKQYSFENYTSVPSIIVNYESDDVHHAMMTEPYRHKRVDNDKIYQRAVENLMPKYKEQSAVELNKSNRSFGNFHSQLNGLGSNIGELTRKESVYNHDKFQFQFNENHPLDSSTIRPLNTRINNKGQNHELIETLSTRLDEKPKQPVSSAQIFTNDNRLFGNVVALVAPSVKEQNNTMKETRCSYIDNDKIYSYNGTSVLTDGDIRFYDAKQKAYNERWSLPTPLQHVCLSKENIGTFCREPLPDDDSINKRVYNNPDPITPIKITKRKNEQNIRVFNSNDEMLNISSARELKSKYIGEQIQKYNTLLTEKLPYQRKIASTHAFTTDDINSSRKSTLPDTTFKMEYVLSTLGTKAPRKPITNDMSIGINTTTSV